MSVDDLVCKMDCQELILHHARCLDEGDREGAATSYTDDAQMVGPTGEVLSAAEAGGRLRPDLIVALKPRIVTNLVVTPTGPDTAEAFAYVTLPRAQFPHGEWHYKLRKTADGWRISWFKALVVEREGEDFAAFAAAATASNASQGSESPTPTS